MRSQDSCGTSWNIRIISEVEDCPTCHAAPADALKSQLRCRTTKAMRQTYSLRSAPTEIILVLWLPNATRQALEIARAKNERSNCLGCQGALYNFLALDLLRLPGRPMLQHGVEDGQKLTHTGRQGDFFDLSRGQEPFVKGFAPRVVTRGDQCAHVQHGAHVRAASPDRPPPTPSPTVAMERRHAHQRRDLLAREGPQLGECQHQRPGTHGPNPWSALQQVVVFPPQRAGPEQRLNVIVERG
jgi:hypothetical protein